MGHFRKNIFRAAFKNKGTYIGAVLIIALGIFVYVSMVDTLKNLQSQVEEYYEKNRMADVFAELMYMPSSELEELEEIPGIKKAAGLLSADVRILTEDMDSIISLHLLGYESDMELNQIRIDSPMPPQKDQIFIGEKMMAARGWKAGQEISIIIEGESHRFTIGGNAYAPNYIYTIPPSGAFLSDGSEYDMAVIDAQRLNDIMGRSRSVNEIGFLLDEGYRYEDMKLILSEKLRQYGLRNIQERKNQTSYNMVEGELEELMAIGLSLPLIFMGMSVFMLYVVLKKIIDQDRRLIGTMKAMGFKNHELILPYLAQAILIGLTGSFLGGAFGGYFGRYMFRLYQDFFVLPGSDYKDFLSTRAFGMVIALFSSIFAVFFGVRGITKIQPAEAMRAASPKILRQFAGFDDALHKLHTMEKMGIRSIFRSFPRTALIALAIAFPFGMSSVLLSFDTILDNLFFVQFERVQVYDLKVSLEKFTTPSRAKDALSGIEGVSETESYCEIPVILRFQNHSDYAILSGLSRGSLMHRIYAMDKRYYEPSGEGLIINERIAKKLGAKEGDRIEISSGYLPEKSSKIMIKKIIGETFGRGCFIDLNAVEEYLYIEKPVNTILINAERGRLKEVKEALIKSSGIFSIADTENMLRTYRERLGSMRFMMDTFIFMTIAAGVILIYNISMISIRERKTEFATLMIMGIKKGEIRRMIFIEQLVYMVLGLIMGFPVAYLCRKFFEAMMVSETYIIEFNIPPFSYVKSFFLCAVILALSTHSILRAIQKIKAVDSLKER